MIVYKATNMDNGKVYIGVTTKTLLYRMKRHLTCSKKKRTYFHHALHKYVFKWDILVDREMSMKKLYAIEKKFIRIYHSQDRDKGYNLAAGGWGRTGYKTSDETKALLSQKAMGNKRCLGKQHSINTRMKISNALKGNTKWLGKKHTDETKALLSQKAMGNKYCLGRLQSIDTRNKISDATKERWKDETFRKMMLNRKHTTWNDDVKKRHSEIMKQKNSDPAYKAMVVEKSRQGRERKRMEKGE